MRAAARSGFNAEQVRVIRSCRSQKWCPKLQTSLREASPKLLYPTAFAVKGADNTEDGLWFSLVWLRCQPPKPVGLNL